MADSVPTKTIPVSWNYVHFVTTVAQDAIHVCHIIHIMRHSTVDLNLGGGGLTVVGVELEKLLQPTT